MISLHNFLLRRLKRRLYKSKVNPNKIFILAFHVVIMEKKFSFDHLSETDFEEFCFDLLKEMDFKNVNWRKGTGKTTSPSDSGRDMECEIFVKDVDNKTNKEKWFFECKHYMKGVPPDKIQGALSWANAERPDKLVIIVSNFLSNPCKNYIVKYIDENKPPFKIKYWELKDLEELTFGKSKLMNKYKLSEGLDFIKIIHPMHIKYASKPHINTLDYFFSIMDDYDSVKRDEIIGATAFLLINPKYEKSITGKEKLNELQIDRTDYKAFKDKCYSLKSSLTDVLIVKLVVNSILEWAFHFGDITSTVHFLEYRKSIVEIMKESLKTEMGEKKDRLSRLIKSQETEIELLPKKTEEFYSIYADFCNVILPKLMEEESMFKDI